MGPLQQMLPTGDRSLLERQASSIGILLSTVLALAARLASTARTRLDPR